MLTKVDWFTDEGRTLRREGDRPFQSQPTIKRQPAPKPLAVQVTATAEASDHRPETEE